MSRIYEALQKAESERGLDREQARQDQVRQEAEPDSTDGRDLSVDPVAVSPSPAAAPAGGVRPLYSAASPAAASQRTDEPGFLQASPFDKVTPRPWTLAVNHLPALQERGAAVEQFRSLRSRLFELRDIKPLKSLLITSGLPQEGKSFISTNLAMSLARHKNSKVLLIDGDMRRYTLHQILGCDSFPGLADYLSGKSSAVEVMQRAQVTHDMSSAARQVLPNLTFISGGNGGDKAADLSGSPRFAELLQNAAPYFDWIIVDSSPVLPVSDGVNLARACDGVLLVARGGVTKFQIAQRAQSELKAANVLGFVLNAVAETANVGGYYGYGYGHDANTADQ